MKKTTLVLFLLLVFFSWTVVDAKEIKTGRVAAMSGLKLRLGPGTNYGANVVITYNSRVTILGEKASESGCSGNWYYVTDSGYYGYVCSQYIADIEVTTVDGDDNEELSAMAQMSDQEYDAYLNSQGFPESYKVKLKELHKQHPNWVFKGVQARYNWTDALNSQDKSGQSFINVPPSRVEQGYQGYLSTAEADYNYLTDTFIPHDGVYWFQANRGAVAYYLDPRNFFNERSVFMFEDETYNSEFQTENVVKAVLGSDYMKQFSGYFMEAAQLYNVSPVYLASLSRQEVGTSDSNIVINGHAGVLKDGVDYTGYYNFFNIGASSSDDPKFMSLKRAKAEGWNNPRDAIVKGAYFISANYINCGQYTSYFQKFNMASTATKGTWHQYSTNILALEGPAGTTYNSYLSYGLIDTGFVFAIPIYSNMPDSTTLPAKGNPNNWLRELKVNGALVSNFDGKNYSYTVNINTNTANIEATPIVSKASITQGIGTINLTQPTTTVEVKVKAQNGDIRTYTVTINSSNFTNNTNNNNNNNSNNENNSNTNNNNNNNSNTEIVVPTSTFNNDGKYLWNVTLGSGVDSIVKGLSTGDATINVTDPNGNPKTSGTVGTGDKVTISQNGTTKTLEIIIYGDLSGDGVINTLDLLTIKKSILRINTLTSTYSKAADVDKNGVVNTLDLLLIKKVILNQANISQS